MIALLALALSATPIAPLPAGMSAIERRAVIKIRDESDSCEAKTGLLGAAGCPSALNGIDDLWDSGWCGVVHGDEAGERWEWRRCSWATTRASRDQMAIFQSRAQRLIANVVWAEGAWRCGILSSSKKLSIQKDADRESVNFSAAMTSGVRSDALGWYSRMIDHGVRSLLPQGPTPKICEIIEGSSP